MKVKNPRHKTVIMVAILALLTVLIYVSHTYSFFTYCTDLTADRLIKSTVVRAAFLAFLTYCIRKTEYKKVIVPHRLSGAALLFCLPCLCVSLANFPFSALLSGTAHIERKDLIFLLLLQCLFVSAFEELFFRGIVHTYIKVKIKSQRYKLLISAGLSALIFALFHLLNIIGGASFFSVLLQVGYTFLLGVMFAVTFDITDNLYVCIFLHAIFNFGGTLIVELGTGEFQDICFVVLTCAAGVVCTISIIVIQIRIQYGKTMLMNFNND